jgi:hypothetical protein
MRKNLGGGRGGMRETGIGKLDRSVFRDNAWIIPSIIAV